MGSAENLRETALEGFCPSMCPSVLILQAVAVASDLEVIIEGSLEY